ncbi:tetratricopeptide repeat protein [Mucilaginibacter myungsuensis]|uniref:Tetratricopeptide repeat protein n=1 Tax=Mucilaginibacter myungsuensis TaxID=649104 RepID=A0A929L5I0_9SPHI|nr:tetratricopeptide repeat protein [Mucilaginibacter myungsuensis]MBE9663586.1 tetratricopeptide repeat protein [Mucilaginibacter myungsuensis]MDN3599090.1 tetratricopeptide repeat protein [Mucilaginibacter myungsuensis]
MRKVTYAALLISACSVTGLYAQQNPGGQIYKTYHDAVELLNKEKYVAAAEQFRIVERSNAKTSTQPDFETSVSLLKENSQYYEAYCALQLGNDDAEAMLLRFIKEHPENPLTKLAYFEIGVSYFKVQKYADALRWFEKVEASALNGRENTEYKFRKGYAYFMAGNLKDAQVLFSEVKDKRSQFMEDAVYYFAYISYLNKDYHIALTNFERLKNSKKYEDSYPYYISAVYFLDKRYDDVLAYAVPILNNTKQKNETEMFRIVAASYFAKSDYVNSVKYYGKFAAQDRGRTQNTQDSYQMGYGYYKTGDYKNAAAELVKMEDKDDVYSQTGSYTLGDAFLKLNNKQSARNAFYKASRLSFDKVLQEDALYQYSKLSYELDFYAQALEATRAYLKNYPRSTRTEEMKILLGEELLNSHSYREAVEILEPIQNKTQSAKIAYQKVAYYRGLEFINERAFENAIGIFLRSQRYPVDPKINALTTYWMAEAMYEVRKYGESVENFERFLDMPQAAGTGLANFANYALAYAAFRDEQYRKAASFFEKFLEGDVKDQNTINDAITRIADSYFVLKSYGKANEYYNKIIARHSQGEDYAEFQRGMIQGLQGSYDAKIGTLNNVLLSFPNSDFADDAAFEIAYAYYLKNDGEKAKSDLLAMIQKYPRSSYIPRALSTIGVIDYNADREDMAVEAFKQIVKDYASTPEAKQALSQIEKIYTDRGDASTFISYAGTTPIGNYTTAQQESIMQTAANNLYLKGDWQGTVSAVNAYYDKFPKPIYEKQMRFIRAMGLIGLKRYDEAVLDFNIILNDWTSAYTEKSLLAISKMYIDLKKYNEAVVYLKRLETNSEYKENYAYAINNLLVCYAQMNMADDALKYAELIKNYEKSGDEDKFKASLYAGKAYLVKGDTTTATKEFNNTVNKTKTVAAAEAKYNLALIEYKQRKYKASQATCFELTKQMPNYDYWVAKTIVLLGDNYVALKDNYQAKATYQSIVDFYKTNDDVLADAKAKLERIAPGSVKDKPTAPADSSKTGNN